MSQNILRHVALIVRNSNAIGKQARRARSWKPRTHFDRRARRGREENFKDRGCPGFDPVRHGRDGTPLPSVSGAQRTSRPTFNLREFANGAGGANDIERKAAKGSGERAGKW